MLYEVITGGVDEDGIVYGPMFELETSSGVSELAPSYNFV